MKFKKSPLLSICYQVNNCFNAERHQNGVYALKAIKTYWKHQVWTAIIFFQIRLPIYEILPYLIIEFLTICSCKNCKKEGCSFLSCIHQPADALTILGIPSTIITIPKLRSNATKKYSFMSFINNLFSLDGKVALVIGGSGVLGGKMAESLALAGAKTAVFYSANKDGAEATVAEITKKGGISASFHADARDAASLKHAITQVKQTWGRIDILVNAPGVNSATPVLELTEDEWQTIIDINLKGAFLASRLVAEIMIEQGEGGSIINISSVSSEIPLSKVFTYGISKAGINNMTKFLARDWAPHNIRVNAVMPGFFPAEQNRKILTEERRQSIFKHTPMKRYGEAFELSGAVVWLASAKASSFVTGAIIPVDGGFTAMTI